MLIEESFTGYVILQNP